MNNDIEILSNCISVAENFFGINFLNKSDYNTIGKKFMEVQRAEKRIPPIVKLYRQTLIDLKRNSTNKKEINLASSTIQFVQLISVIDSCDLEEPFFNKLITLFKVPEYDKFNSARHELLVYCKYKKSKYTIFSIPEGETKTPDFKITLPFASLIECKSILPDEKKDSSNITEILEVIKRKLEKLHASGLMQITLKSSNLVEVNNEVSEFIVSSIGKNITQSIEGVFCDIHFTQVSIINSIQDFVIAYPIKKQDIGIAEFRKSGPGFKIIGINISPLRLNNYLVPLENHIKKAKKQFTDNNLGILHVQFPEISNLVLTDIIKTHSRIIYKHLLNKKISALVLEFPCISQTNNGKSNVYPNISLPYLNSEIDCSSILEANPYWVNSLQIIDSREEIKCVFIEFDINTESKTAVAFFATKNNSIQAKIILILNNLFIETRDLNSLSFTEFRIDQSIIKQTNKLAYNFGTEKAAINGKIIEGKITSHNNIYKK